MEPYVQVVLDTEFTSLTQQAQLLSLALVAETGAVFYAEFSDFKKEEINDWVNTHVINNFLMQEMDVHFSVENKRTQVKGNKEYIVTLLREWLKQFGNIRMWADVPHYDWVLFCELFGGSMKLPNNVHFMCMDIATLLHTQGLDHTAERISLINDDETPANYKTHNALNDAELGMILLNKYSHGKNTI